MKHLFLSLLTLLVLAAATAAQGNTPTSVTAVIVKYKSDPCFNQLDKLERPTSTKLVPLVCPETECGAKWADVISTYANARDNAWGLMAHVLAFHRDLACVKATNVTVIPPNVGPSNTTERDESTRVAKPATCVEDLDNQSGNPPAPVGMVLGALTSWSASIPGDALRAAHSAINQVRRTAAKGEVCDPSKCTYKYMNQWYLWLTQIPDAYLTAMRADQRATFGMMDGPQEAASVFQQEVVAKCAEGGSGKPWERKVGGLGVGKLEAGSSVPKKVEAAPISGNWAGAVGPSVMAAAALVVSLMMTV